MMVVYLLMVFCFLLLIYSLVISKVQRYQFMNKYKIVLELLDHFLKTTYTVIYNEQLIAYTSQGTTNVQKDQLETIERNFIKLSIEIMGPLNESIMIDFFGTRQAMIHNIVLYFRQRLEQDEISKALRTKMTPNE